MKNAIRMVPIMCLLALGVTSCSDTGGGGGYDAIPTITVPRATFATTATSSAASEAELFVTVSGCVANAHCH